MTNTSLEGVVQQIEQAELMLLDLAVVLAEAHRNAVRGGVRGLRFDNAEGALQALLGDVRNLQSAALRLGGPTGSEPVAYAEAA